MASYDEKYQKKLLSKEDKMAAKKKKTKKAAKSSKKSKKSAKHQCEFCWLIMLNSLKNENNPW